MALHVKFFSCIQELATHISQKTLVERKGFAVDGNIGGFEGWDVRITFKTHLVHAATARHEPLVWAARTVKNGIRFKLEGARRTLRKSVFSSVSSSLFPKYPITTNLLSLRCFKRR